MQRLGIRTWAWNLWPATRTNSVHFALSSLQNCESVLNPEFKSRDNVLVAGTATGLVLHVVGDRALRVRRFSEGIR
jgi:hypothetical protein